MRHALLLLLCILTGFSSPAQKSVNEQVLADKLFKPYQNYFNPDHEWVYTHLNKSSYLQGDDIWFTAYVLNPANGLLNFTTSKLYAELWSPDKKLVNRKILFVNAGTSNHFIHLPDSLPPGTYCFRSYTSWMLNFYPEKDFNNLITILGQQNESKIETFSKKNKNTPLPGSPEKIPYAVPGSDYDIQFLPESGTFLEGIDNILGIRATDSSGRGIAINGRVLNSENQEISTFSTSGSGITNMSIPAVSPLPYRAMIILPDSSIRELQLPKAEPNGVVIQVNPFGSKAVWFRMQTNETTRQMNKSFTAMIHANGILFNTYLFNFSKSNSVQFKIDKKEITTGIVYATVFDENLLPVAERIFYNRGNATRGNLLLKTRQLSNDSVKLNLCITDSLSGSQFSKLSLSVLPGGSVLNHFTNSLLAESVFRPALKGYIDNPDSYFEKTDMQQLVTIDNLLLTQGWRKYDWPTILTDSSCRFTYPFEEAFSIQGSVRNWMKNKPELKSTITLISPMNSIFLLSPVDSVGKFKFDHLFLNDSTWIIAAASSDKGKNWNRTLQMTVPESFGKTPEFQQPVTNHLNREESPEKIPRLTKGRILLPEMVVKATKKNPFSDNIYVGMMDKTLELTKENFNRFHSMEMLLMIQFNVRTEQLQSGEYHFNMGRGTTSFAGKDSEPRMMIDGAKVYSAQEILSFPLELVQAVAVNKDGFGGGMDGSSGTIAIQTRSTPLFENNSEASNIKRLLVAGYTPPKKYFEPKYIISPGTPDYEKYAAIFWKPDLLTDSTGQASFNFIVPKEIKTIAVRIEGISSDGKVFLHNQKINLPGRD